VTLLALVLLLGLAMLSYTLGLEVITSEIRRGEDIAPAFEALKGRTEALYVVIDPLVNTQRIRINTLALGARLLTMCSWREAVEAGILISFGPNYPDLFRRAADLVDKTLRGAKPADIPSRGAMADKSFGASFPIQNGLSCGSDVLCCRYAVVVRARMDREALSERVLCPSTAGNRAKRSIRPLPIRPRSTKQQQWQTASTWRTLPERGIVYSNAPQL
jgi:hypothetical protein